jgi:hypothetical protein
MQIIDILEALGDRARSLPDSAPLEAVLRVRFVRRRGRVETEVRLSDGRVTWRGRGRGATPHEALEEAVA